MRLHSRGASLLLGTACCLLFAACGPTEQETITTTTTEGLQLREVGDIYRVHCLEKNAPPRKLADLVYYEQGFPMALIGVRSGDIAVYWGGELSGADQDEPGAVPSDKVLAYESRVPQEGGYVLLADRTIKKMTAEEFQAAPKAAEVAGGAEPAKKK